MPAQTKRDWQRVPNSYVWNTLGLITLCQNVNVPAGVSATTVNASYAAVFPLPLAVKVAKVAIACSLVSGTGATVNIAYGIGSGTLLSGTPIYTPIVGDDSFNGPPPGGMGAPSTACYAAQNQAVLWNTATGTVGDVAITTTNFPGLTAGSGCIAVFGQADAAGTKAGIINADVVYPTGNASGGTIASGYCGFFAVRFNTDHASTLSGVSINLGLEPITLSENWAAPYFTNGYPIPGISGAF